jgi:hypothetical protein
MRLATDKAFPSHHLLVAPTTVQVVAAVCLELWGTQGDDGLRQYKVAGEFGHRLC